MAIAMLAVLAAAPGAFAKTRTYHASLMTAPLTTADGYPGVGGTALLAGSLNTDRFGAGATIDRVKVTGQPMGGRVFTFEGTETDYFAAGTTRNRFTGTSLVNDDGSQDIDIEGELTGGTGRYRGAKGHYKFSGTVASGESVLTGHSKGRVTF
jgi:hypothetical protein